MNNNEIFNKLNSFQASDTQFAVFSVDAESCYFGKDNDNNVVFMIPSTLGNATPLHQKTASLIFFFNRMCIFELEGYTTSRMVHILICKEHSSDKILAFIRLTRAFAQTERDNDQLYLSKLFSSLSALFNKGTEASDKEMQGLFAELYTLIHFKKIGCDISKYWQSKNMMKFDFTLTEEKRIEIKSTLLSSRTHHFKHDQLLSTLYDIRIVSIMLRKSDIGISLQDMIEQVIDEYPTEYALLMHIEAIVANIEKERLMETKYDPIYLKMNLKYYDAMKIPHFNEKTPEGVFNPEYDCILDNSPYISEAQMISWIQEG